VPERQPVASAAHLGRRPLVGDGTARRDFRVIADRLSEMALARAIVGLARG